MKLINVDDIKWQKGVFVNPMTDKPTPIIHKIATIEMLRDWQEEVKAIPLDKVKQAREEIEQLKHKATDIEGYRWWNNAIENCLHEIDKLIESEG